MSLLDNQTKVNLGSAFYAAVGSGGGGGSGGNIVASTITLTGTDPISATLASNPNDGFEVRNGGGGNNVLVLAEIDAENPGQAEFGIRSLSTISGNEVPRGRYEMNLIPSTDAASLSYTLDRNASGNASTIGSVAFEPGTSPATGVVIVKGEDTTALTVGNGGIRGGPAGADLIVRKATVASAGNIYVPAAGTTQNMAQFSTIAGHQYELYIPNLRIQNEPAGVPAAGAWCDLSVDTAGSVTYLDTFDMASVSTIANDLQKAPCYTFYATGTGHVLSATGSLANTLSTAVTVSPALVYLRDLGAQSTMPPAV